MLQRGWQYNMAGWNLKKGSISEYNVSEDCIWSLFNFLFSDSSRKRNTYKFGFIKSLLDNIFNGQIVTNGIFYSYDDLFAKFAENYWNLIVKYNLKQMRKDGQSQYSKIEIIFKEAISKDKVLEFLEFDSIEIEKRISIISKVTKECKKCVVGALYKDFDCKIYSFDLSQNGLVLNYCIYEFIIKHKAELEKLNYYSWARFLEQVNNDNVLVRVIDKLELATPRRNNLTIYREILRKEFEEDICFYCGKKLKRKIHVDHFIPWSFIKDDKMWNFVLACPECNIRKSNKLPDEKYIAKLEERNKEFEGLNNRIIINDFQCYYDELLSRMWKYAKMSGLKEYKFNN